jgi:acyl-CoA-binding protein
MKNIICLLIFAVDLSFSMTVALVNHSPCLSRHSYNERRQNGGDSAIGYDATQQLVSDVDDLSEVITSQEALDLLILFMQGLIVNAHDANPEALDFLNSLNETLAELVGSIVDVSISAELNYDPENFASEQEVIAFFQVHTTQAQVENYYKQRPGGRPLDRREKAELVLNTFAYIAGNVADVLGSEDPKNPQVIGQAAGGIIGAIVSAARESVHKNVIDGDEEYELVSSYLLENSDFREAVERMLVEKIADIRAGTV